MLCYLPAEADVPEAMNRLQQMMKAGVLETGDTIRYTYKASSKSHAFQAELADDGSLVNAKEVADRDEGGDDATADKSKQGEQAADGKQAARPKGEAAVFSSPTDFATAMYKRTVSTGSRGSKRKPSINGWADCTVNGKTLKDLRGVMLHERKNASSAADHSAAKAVQKRPASPATAADRSTPKKGVSSKKTASPKKKAPPANGRPETAAGKDKTDPEEADVEPKQEEAKGTVASDAIDTSKDKDGPKSSGKDAMEAEPEADAKELESVMKDKAASADADKKNRKAESSRRSPSPERDSSPARKSEGKTSNHDGETLSARKKSSKTRKASSKKVQSPSPAPEGKKRKRTDSDSPPSVAGSASVDRRKGSRNKSRRRLNAETLPTMDLDPDAVEAAAVAAQAEKEERLAARRTTRLAAGKIGKVDYNVATGVLSKPSGNADNDESDGELNSNEHIAEEPRKSRRREGVERERHRDRPRSSRRQTRKRASREQSPGRNVEETRNSKRGSRNGSRNESRNESRNGGSEPNTRGPSVSKEEMMDIDTGSGTGSHESDVEYDEADDFSARNMNDRDDEGGWTINCLTEIAKSVHRTGQITGSAIATDLKKEKLLHSLGVSEKDIVDKLKEVTSHIKEFQSKISDAADYSVRVNDVLSFFATDIDRMRTGQARPVYTAQQRIARGEKRKVGLEKRKRRTKRDVDESMGKLDAEMESRRKADLEAALATMELRELERTRERVAENKKKLEREIRYVKAQERDAKKRVDRSRRLYVKLVEKAEINDAPKPDLSVAESTAPAAPSSSKKPRQTLSANSNDSRRTIGESFTSDDERRMNIDSKAPRPAAEVESSPPDPRVQSEVDRMRGLVSMRALEAAEEQRKCEELYLQYRTLMDSKERLDEELYVNQRAAAVFQGATARPPAGPRGREERRGKGGPGRQANGGNKGGRGKATANAGAGARNGGKKTRREEGKSRRKGAKAGAGNA